MRFGRRRCECASGDIGTTNAIGSKMAYARRCLQNVILTDGAMLRACERLAAICYIGNRGYGNQNKVNVSLQR